MLNKWIIENSVHLFVTCITPFEQNYLGQTLQNQPLQIWSKQSLFRSEREAALSAELKFEITASFLWIFVLM